MSICDVDVDMCVGKWFVCSLVLTYKLAAMVGKGRYFRRNITGTEDGHATYECGSRNHKKTFLIKHSSSVAVTATVAHYFFVLVPIVIETNE